MGRTFTLRAKKLPLGPAPDARNQGQHDRYPLIVQSVLRLRKS